MGAEKADLPGGIGDLDSALSNSSSSTVSQAPNQFDHLKADGLKKW